MSGYIGNIPVPQATQSREVFTATSGQTTFATVGYPVGFCDVWLNGVKLINGTDFTATNGSDVVLTVGATTGDTVEVISNSTFEVNSQTFTGTTTLTGDLQATTATFSGAMTGTNLTLSGGVYLGGTGAANLLDDYEEGTWTPRVADYGTGADLTTTGNFIGTYTKVGNLVSLRGVIEVSGTLATGTVSVWGLPFTVSNSDLSAYAPGACLTRKVNLNGGSYIVMEPSKGSSRCLPLIVFSGTGATTSTITNGLVGSGLNLNFTIAYYTS